MGLKERFFPGPRGLDLLDDVGRTIWPHDYKRDALNRKNLSHTMRKLDLSQTDPPRQLSECFRTRDNAQ